MGMGMSLVVWPGYSNDKRSCVLRLCGSIELGLNEIEVMYIRQNGRRTMHSMEAIGMMKDASSNNGTQYRG